ncbi:hypothetical protein HG531_012547 [Fusarium graminearum]|nr:hypothetical protein HG531_012547 [Fusarium graminearum]
MAFIHTEVLNRSMGFSPSRRHASSLPGFELPALLFQPDVSLLLFSFSHSQVSLLVSLQLDKFMMGYGIDKRLEFNINSLHLFPASFPSAATDQTVAGVYLDTEDLALAKRLVSSCWKGRDNDRIRGCEHDASREAQVPPVTAPREPHSRSEDEAGGYHVQRCSSGSAFSRTSPQGHLRGSNVTWRRTSGGVDLLKRGGVLLGEYCSEKRGELILDELGRGALRPERGEPPTVEPGGDDICIALTEEGDRKMGRGLPRIVGIKSSSSLSYSEKPEMPEIPETRGDLVIRKLSLFSVCDGLFKLGGRLVLVFLDRLVVVVEILGGSVWDRNILGGNICRRGVLNWSFGSSILSNSDVFDRGRFLVVLIFCIVQ